MSRTRALLAPALFGVIDGLVVIIGLLLPLHTDPAALVAGGVGAAIAESVGMAAGSWLSQDNDAGWREAATVGVASGAGAMAPLAPYMLLAAGPALVWSVAVVVAEATVVAVARWRWQHRPLPRAALETLGILTVVACCVAACARLLGT